MEENKTKEPKDITLLIVEDEELLRSALCLMFRRRGFNVLDAPNGTIGLQLVLKNKIDVVLSDIRMPDGDGVELLDSIKAQHPELPVVIFISGYSDLALEDAYHKGADAVFSKPFDRAALLAAVYRAVGTKEQNWGARKHERTESSFSIELRFPDLSSAMSGKVLNIGRGGMFITLEGKLPVAESRVEFRIHFNQGEMILIEGSGIVRWIRATFSIGQPVGCGIEFESLTDYCRSSIIRLINELKTKSFIPKQ